jgi:hypothetical protein
LRFKENRPDRLPPDIKMIEIRSDIMFVRREWDAIERSVYLNLDSHEGAVQSAQDHSIARWDGDTLVIDIARFTPQRSGNGIACEQLQIRVAGDPSITAACSCQQCHRRTGSLFGAVAFFDDDRIIETVGDCSCFERPSDSGRTVKINFCPNCGSSVFWKVQILEGSTGIAVGCFADPDFPKPQFVAWTATQHSWLRFPEDCRFSISQNF